jgi:hypothetical protein
MISLNDKAEIAPMFVSEATEQVSSPASTASFG